MRLGIQKLAFEANKKWHTFVLTIFLSLSASCRRSYSLIESSEILSSQSLFATALTGPCSSRVISAAENAFE